MEVFDLYDREFNLLDKKMERGTQNEKGEYHLVVHIWFRNSEGKYLLQQRNKTTDRIPHQWAATGGAVTTGEDSITGAIRETEEEIGVKLVESDFKFVNRYFVEDDYSNYITDLYLVEKDIDISNCIIDPNEVKSLEYFTLDEYLELVKNKQAWNYTRLLSRSSYYLDLEKS